MYRQCQDIMHAPVNTKPINQKSSLFFGDLFAVEINVFELFGEYVHGVGDGGHGNANLLSDLLNFLNSFLKFLKVIEFVLFLCHSSCVALFDHEKVSA